MESGSIASGDLADLVSSHGSTTIYPNEDSILSVLQARFRGDLNYTAIGASNLVVVNPNKTLSNVNDISAKSYVDAYKDTSIPTISDPRPLQPHVYSLASKVYLVMKRSNETQAVVARGITGSGKSSSSRLFVDQILRLSTHSKREAKIADQIKALGPLLDAFGNAKTLLNPNASRHGRYLELGFNERGRIASGKVLTYGLDKSRLVRLCHEERSYHVFYQLLAGASPQERDLYNLEDPSDYALLASSGCYRLPSGPFSDDAIAMSELRSAMKTLGFKAKHITSIFSLLVAILLLGNLTFLDGDHIDVSAYVVELQVLDHVSRLLGVTAEELGQSLTNRTSYVRKELYTVLLDAEQSAIQRDQLVRDLYAILFAFVVETANHKIAPVESPTTQVIVLDQPGHQSRGPAGTGSMAAAPLISAYGQNEFDEFCINLCDEVMHSYVLRHTFEDSVGYNSHLTGDGVTLPVIATMDNSACIELIRGAQLNERAHRKPGGMLGVMNKSSSSFKSGKGADTRNDDLLQELTSRFSAHASFVAPTNNARHSFGINHYAGSVTYDTSSFVERDTDLLDSAFVSLLRNSTDGFVSKLLSGPSLAAEKHSKDEAIIVQAQVSSRPLRQPTAIPSPKGELPTDEHARLDAAKTYPVSTQLNYTLSEVCTSLDRARLWTISCIRPNDSGSSNSFDKRRVKAQIRSLFLPDLVSRKSMEYIADFEKAEFCERYVPTMRGSDEERITQCARANGWKEGVDFMIGLRSVWLSYPAWKIVEDGLRAVEKEQKHSIDDTESVVGPDDATEYTHTNQGSSSMQQGYYEESEEGNLLNSGGAPRPAYGAGGLSTPRGFGDGGTGGGGAWGSSEWDKSREGGETTPNKEAGDLVVNTAPTAVEELPTSGLRRGWLWLVWGMTFWCPGFLLKSLGRMKRPDVQLAWREKLTIFMLIFFMNAFVIFFIVGFGRLLCPSLDKVWAVGEVGAHTTEDDYWVAVQGEVYDVSDFVFSDHSDISGLISNDAASLEILAGQDMTYYFPVPLALGCEGLVSDWNMALTIKNVTTEATTAIHNSGSSVQYESSKLHDDNWYRDVFKKKMNNFHKGPLVWTATEVKAQARDTDINRLWGYYHDGVYDLTDYVNTLTAFAGASDQYEFLNEDVVDVFKQSAGSDMTDALDEVFATMDPTQAALHSLCLNNVFYWGKKDIRKEAQCVTADYILLAATIILVGSMVMKFIAALQFGGKRTPEMQDKFVLCQVPCYTEGEDSLRRTIDSLSALEYDDKRKLMFIICDGNIIGSGNDRTTPRIVLDILGIDPKLDPEPLLFKSIGEGSKALNYAKVYSGLYEFEGHVVPYMVVVKVGKPSERSKPGNRGKRDSQILLMHYLNRVHFDAPMSPLELEMYHQMRNVIGIDPAFYEYIFTVDADTTVTPDSLNRLVAAASDDSSIIGVCGETKLENEEGSWWTMIQVYEYYISHHLSKAFESLFGSVTCLPGCFSLYRIRTADKGRPILISNRVIDEYSEPNVDTLHKKNLFSLGEDRFLTTLLMKHFPTFKTKFVPHALARTVAPESWRVLFSQRRRWINSTVHNLCELVVLPELFGFCCFSMRFFVFIDLLGTIILPATVVYLAYLITIVATGKAALPLFSIIMIAAVYGLQAVIFLLHREFMLIGWMIVYILSFPVYSFFLPVYSFWCMDEFGWGNTRLVIGEGSSKKVIVADDDKFDDSMIPLKKFSEYEAEAWEHGTHHSDEKSGYNSKPPSRFPDGSRGGSRAGSPGFNQASQSGDFYRDTNLTYNNVSNPNLRLGGGSQLSHSNMSMHGAPPQLPMSQYGIPGQNPFMPPMFGGSQHGAGSDYGGQMQLPPMGFQNTGGSMYGMPPGGPRNTMMPMFNSGASMSGQSMFAPPNAPFGMQGGQRPMSTFSVATTANPFAGPSTNANPTDDDLFQAVRQYLSQQDLMTVTKKTTREAITAKFPQADLSGKKEFLNNSIDSILSES